jgi:hypothetical protein
MRDAKHIVGKDPTAAAAPAADARGGWLQGVLLHQQRCQLLQRLHAIDLGTTGLALSGWFT